MSKRNVKNQLEACTPGDLICCEWCDASVGQSSSNGGSIDVPVKSWGVFVGILGKKAKHIVLAQNSFQYADGLFDLDYTAIPLGWVMEVSVIANDYLPKDVAQDIVNSFVIKDRKILTRSNRSRAYFQQRLSLHGRRH